MSVHVSILIDHDDPGTEVATALHAMVNAAAEHLPAGAIVRSASVTAYTDDDGPGMPVVQAGDVIRLTLRVDGHDQRCGLVLVADAHEGGDEEPDALTLDLPSTALPEPRMEAGA